MSDSLQLFKEAGITLPLKEHQQRIADRLKNETGVIAAHSTGTGKSLSGIGAYQSLGLPTTIVVPAALRKNYQKELKKFLGKIPNDISIQSQQNIARKGFKDVPGGLMIVDEAQKLNNPESKLYKELRKSKAAKRLLLSGTPVQNAPYDISPLVNLAANKTLLPENPREFLSKYVTQKQHDPGFFAKLRGAPSGGMVDTLQHKDELRNILQKYIDVHQLGKDENYPTASEEVVKVPMNQHQTDIYNTMMSKAPWLVRQRVKWGLPAGMKDIEKMKAFLTGPREVGDSPAMFTKSSTVGDSPKIDAAIASMKQRMETDPNFKSVMYSNFVNAGINPAKKRLEEENIPYGEFSGNMSPRDRNKMVNQYNNNKLKTLLLSQAGAEGLDLKGTKLIQILEPHFQVPREKQVEGRGIRYMSHAALPEDERHVHIQRFMAEPRGNFMQRLFKQNNPGVDEYIYNAARNKDRLNNQLMELADPSKNPSIFQRMLHRGE